MGKYLMSVSASAGGFQTKIFGMNKFMGFRLAELFSYETVDGKICEECSKTQFATKKFALECVIVLHQRAMRKFYTR